MSNEIEKKSEQASQSIEVTELEDTMLDAAVGGVFSQSLASVAVNGHCPIVTNSAAGCGVKST